MSRFVVLGALLLVQPSVAAESRRACHEGLVIPERLAARRDSFTLAAGGPVRGWQRSILEPRAEGYRYREDTWIGGRLVQQTDLDLGADLAMQRVTQTVPSMGSGRSLDIRYVKDHVRGTTVVPSPTGHETHPVDQAVPHCVIDDNALAAMLPAIRWSQGASWMLPVFSAGAGTMQEATLRIGGVDTVTVPAGKFTAFRATLDMAGQQLVVFVTTAAPHRVLRATSSAGAFELNLAR